MTTPMTDERLDVSGARLWLATLPDGNRAAWLRILLHEHDEIDRLRAEVERLRAEKDGAYHERNQVVAALAKLFPSGIAVDPNEPDWPVLYIDLPDGQVSWHFQRSEALELLAGIPTYDGEWDGHSTEEKYARLQALAPRYFHLANFLRPEPAP